MQDMMPRQISPIDLSADSIDVWLGERPSSMRKELARQDVVEEWTALYSDVEAEMTALCAAMNEAAPYGVEPFSAVSAVRDMRTILAYTDSSRRYRILSFLADAEWGGGGSVVLSSPSQDQDDALNKAVLESSLRQLYGARLLNEIFNEDALSAIVAAINAVKGMEQQV